MEIPVYYELYGLNLHFEDFLLQKILFYYETPVYCGVKIQL